MSSVILHNISKPSSLLDTPGIRALSYGDWVNRNVGISFNDVDAQYADYLRTFNKSKEENTINSREKLREDYVILLQQIQSLFQNDEEFSKYIDIDFDSNDDLALVIPRYAKKLKELAQYYIKKRQETKNKKIEYNLTGSHEGVIKLVYSNVVSKFTKTGEGVFVNENPLISDSPTFSEISRDFAVEIEELYDTEDYYLKDRTNIINPFTCLFNNICNSLVSVPLSAKADPIEGQYICDISNDTVDSLLFSAYAKYLSTDNRYISGGYYTENLKEFVIPLELGNNFFYWFSGETVFDVPEGIYGKIPINDIMWTGATGGSAMLVSDLIFVNAGNILTEGAWLQDTKFATVTATMHATIVDGKIFKFPYPDFGVSAVGGAWSGPGLDDTIKKSRKFFPTEENFTNTETAINNIYWTATVTASTVKPVYLQETSLGNGGFASNKFTNADKVFVTDDDPAGIVYSGERRVAWLYDLTQTQIPIKPGTNRVYYPLRRYEQDSDLLFNFDDGVPVTLSSVDVGDSFVGAVAGLTLQEADLIIKNQTICGPQVEMAWLKALPIRFFTNFNTGPCDCDPAFKSFYTDWQYVSGGIQIGISFRCDSDRYHRFVWTGDTIDINRVRGFTGFAHDDTCPYKYLDHSTSIIDTNFLNSSNREIFERWKKCSCQAIQYSPFGHVHDSMEHFKITPDFIVRDTKFPKSFNKKTWLGRDGKNFATSVDCARFYPTHIEPDVGWGEGQWKKGDGTTGFMLEKGVSYIYYRADTNNCTFDSPYFIINQKYEPGVVPNDECIKESYYPTWMKAVQDPNGVWVDAGVVSDMTLEFGDFLDYVHRDDYQEVSEKLLYDDVEIPTISGLRVNLPKADTKISFSTHHNNVPSVNFLIKIPVSSTVSMWGQGDHGKDVEPSKNSFINPMDFRIEFDYLQLTQPLPSEILLKDGNIVEYKFGKCNDTCFVWDEPLSFEAYAPVRKWNKFIFDDCVGSEILGYLNSQITNCHKERLNCNSDCSSINSCGCDNYCLPTKSGLTATRIDSNIIFNTELSGVPMFVNYYARKKFDQKITLIDITDGEQSLFVPTVTGNLAEPLTPWRDILNQSGPNFITEELVTNLQTADEIHFYKPKRVGMNRYETFDSKSNFVIGASGVNVYRTDNYFDTPFRKMGPDSSYVTEHSLGVNQGRILTQKRQTFVPYTNAQEKSNREFYGLFAPSMRFTPWSRETGRWDASDIYKTEHGFYNIKCDNDWFDDQLEISGDVWDWQTDIFGNQYFDTRNEELTYKALPTTYSTIFIKTPSGSIKTLSDALSSFTTVYTSLTGRITEDFLEILEI